jgi:hypothetical protein
MTARQTYAEHGRERFPLSGLLAALGAAQRERPRVRIIVSGLSTLSLNLKRARSYVTRPRAARTPGRCEPAPDPSTM